MIYKKLTRLLGFGLSFVTAVADVGVKVAVMIGDEIWGEQTFTEKEESPEPNNLHEAQGLDNILNHLTTAVLCIASLTACVQILKLLKAKHDQNLPFGKSQNLRSKASFTGKHAKAFQTQRTMTVSPTFTPQRNAIRVRSAEDISKNTQDTNTPSSSKDFGVFRGKKRK